MYSQNLHIKSFVAQSKPAGERATAPQHIYLLSSDYINQHCSHFDRLHLLPRCNIELPPHRLKLPLAVKYRFVVSAKTSGTTEFGIEMRAEAARQYAQTVIERF